MQEEGSEKQVDVILSKIETHTFSVHQCSRIMEQCLNEIAFQRKYGDYASCLVAKNNAAMTKRWLYAAFKKWESDSPFLNSKNYGDDESLVGYLKETRNYRTAKLLLIPSLGDAFRCCFTDCAGEKHFSGTVYLWILSPDDFYFCDHCANNNLCIKGKESLVGLVGELYERELREIYVKQFKDALLGKKKKKKRKMKE